MSLVENGVFAVVLIVALALFSRSVKQLIATLRSVGKPVDRFDHPWERVRNVLRVALGQSKLLREPFAGILHLLIFWGFLVLITAIAESIGLGLIPGFSMAWLGPVYPLLSFCQELVAVLVTLAVGVSLYRRIVAPPKRLRVEGHAKRDALLILTMILAVMVTMIGQNTSALVLRHKDEGAHFVSATFAFLLKGRQVGIVATLFHVFFWLHILIVLVFLNYLPRSKHLHVLTSIPNVYLSSLGPKGAIKPINLADETLTKFGATDVDDLTWKQLLDGYTCTECGRCTSVCPAQATGKKLDPRKIITDVRARTFERASLATTGDTQLSSHQLLDNFITEEELWACTTCMACVQECPVVIEHVDVIVDLRKGLVLNESRFPDELKSTFSNLERNYTPWGFGHSTRADWARGLGIPLMSEKRSAEFLFWVGCAGAYDSRYQAVSRAFAMLLTRAGVDYAILGTEEKCTGDPARRMGNEYLAQSLMTENIATLQSYGVKKILVTCPHCLQSLGKEYKQFGGDYEVIHHSRFLQKLIAERKIELKKAQPHTVSFHDPCYLGRYQDDYEAPRALIDAVPGVQRVEMENNRSRSFCCGAGGGRMWMEEKEGKRINLERTDQALAVSPDIIGTGCPFCMTMLTDGVKDRDQAERVRVKDIAEIVLEATVS